MHPHTHELLDHIDTQRAVLHHAVGTVPAALRDQRPAPEQWSVAEVLEHLSVVERRIAQLLDASLSAARSAGLGPENDTSSVMDPALTAQLLNRSNFVKVPEMVRPRGELNAQAASDALDHTRLHLRTVIMNGDGLAVRQIVQPHPVLGPLNFHQWIVTVGSHEARHALQIEDIGRTLTTV